MQADTAPPDPPTISATARFPALTGLRGVAALWVVLYHLTLHEGLPVLDHGYAGVDVFFILSGFVLSHVYLRDRDLLTPGGYRRFLGVRLARIYPLHLATLLGLLALVVGYPALVAHYDGDARATFGAGGFIASLLLVQNWGVWTPLTWNIPSWSLSAEWFAYLVFPLLLVPIRRIRSPEVLALGAALLLAALAAALRLSAHDSIDVPGRGGMVRMGCEFTAGCLIYAACLHRRLPDGAGLVAAGALLAAGLAVPGEAILMVFAFALCIVLAAQGGNAVARGLACRPVEFLGEISYSLYLVHWSVVLLLRHAAETGWTAASPLAAKAVALALCLGLSVLTYTWIERPARAWGRALVTQGARASVRPPLPRRHPAR